MVFFATVGPKLAESIPKTTKGFDEYVKKVSNTMPEYELTNEEFRNAFFSLKSNKSPGYDGISSNIVKNCFHSISSPLKHIFNLSIQKGMFPDSLKIAKVTPIFKAGEKCFVTNYRPISVLSCFSKILERIIHNRLMLHLVQNKILYCKQFGFQQSNSTEHVIIQLIDQISYSFEQNKFTLGVFIDLSKAFDTVDHNILLNKLEFYGVKNSNLKWFESYLHKKTTIHRL